MGRELQKKKRRSGRQPVRQPNRTKKILNPRGNDAIAKNWCARSPAAISYSYRALTRLSQEQE